ncbi:MAG: hypothetical protein ACK45V_08125, partial [Brevundimonas sp.]
MPHSRLQVLSALEAQGVCPVFYHADPETCLEVIRACARGGAPVVEFTNRGDFACDLFGEIAAVGELYHRGPAAGAGADHLEAGLRVGVIEHRADALGF